MIRAIVIGGLLGLAGIASADGASPARAHARSSTTLYLASAWSPGPTVPIRLGVEGAVRFHHGNFALETRLGLGGAGSVTALSSRLAAHAGGSLGLALPVSGRVVIAPMLAYDWFAEWEYEGTSLSVHYVTLEVPIAIVLDRGVILEPFVQAGIARFHGATDPVLVIGPRLGIAF